LRKINRGANIDPVLGAHSRRESTLDCVESLLGPDIKFFSDQFFIKPPGGIEKTYHQDSPYFTIEPMALVTAWAALDDATVTNGCLYIVPGSHRNGALDHSEAWLVGDRTNMRIPDREIDRSKEHPVLLKAGDVSFHHSLILHRSGPNTSSQFRRGYAVHYMSARSRWTGDPAEKPGYPLLRGKEFEHCV
jgi:phytanoyl-CoA hydroxylase